MLQDIAALTIVALAAAWLTRRFWSTFTARRDTGCAKGCGTCAASKPSIQVDVATIGRVDRGR